MSRGHSWREQRKAVVMTVRDPNHLSVFDSLWQASHMVAELFDCKPDTAKKEIKKAIITGCARYGATWRWKEETEQ